MTIQQDEREIRALVATRMEATKAGDIDKVLSLMTSDVVSSLPAGRRCARMTSQRQRAR